MGIVAWDANLVTPYKRMDNAGISLDCLCDGEKMMSCHHCVK
ncbi:hypothetical protein I3842_13G029200 [Carya illinoinensis]|uniref:Uncharacterized protein n=1 Tax=Carya illinoinensis TaxID=32201 RepID=A0A922D5G8_CARIL|nr:hypothetical protein I3842_13G029200 [Carya illinoinensis]